MESKYSTVRTISYALVITQIYVEVECDCDASQNVDPGLSSIASHHHEISKQNALSEQNYVAVPGRRRKSMCGRL
jgi:hypothetical protein